MPVINFVAEYRCRVDFSKITDIGPSLFRSLCPLLGMRLSFNFVNV